MNGRNQGERRRWLDSRWIAVVTALALLGLPALANLTRVEAGRFSVRGCDCLRLRIETNGGAGKRVLVTIGGNEITFQTDAQGKADTGYLTIPAGATSVKVELLDKVDEGWPVCCTIPLTEVPVGRYERVPSCMDLAPPAVRIRLDPAPTGYGWNRSAVTVILAAGDDRSGPAKICYTLTGAAAQGERCVPFPAQVACGVTPPSVETKFGVSREGVTTVSYHAVDGWGNRSATGAGEVRIDLTPPTITGFATPAPNEHGWNKEPVRVTFHCSDGLSGIASCTGDREITGEGKNQAVTGSATDKAGNTNSYTVGNINIDLTRPVITVGEARGTRGNAGWFVSEVTVPFTAADNLSGFAPDGRLTMEGTRSTAEEGKAVRLRVSVTDRAGNVGEVSAGPFSIDRTKPTIRLDGRSAPGEAVVSWQITDAVSGVDTGSCLVAVSGPGITGVGGRATLSRDCSGQVTLRFDQYGAGEFTVRARGRDVAGNEDESPPVRVTITPPYGAIRGQVVDATTNEPIAGALVRLSPALSTTTDRYGTFLFADLQPGTYTVWAEADGYAGTSRDVTCEAGKTAEIVLALSPIAVGILVIDNNCGWARRAVETLGFSFTVKTQPEFAYMSAADIRQFKIVLVGWSGDCDSPDISGLRSNRAALAEAINGRVVLSHQDPDWHTAEGHSSHDRTNAQKLLRNMIEWVSQGPGTGLIALADPVGKWDWTPWAGTIAGHYNREGDEDVRIRVDHPVYRGLNDADVSNWEVSHHGYLDIDLPGFTTIATASDANKRVTVVRDR